MNYQEAFAYITELQSRKGSDYSLEPMRRLCSMAGRPDQALSVVHIAGTNGKGSVGTYLSNILARAGYTVGRYVSPTLLEYRERIQRIWFETEQIAVASDTEKRTCECSDRLLIEYISEQEVAEHLTYLQNLVEQMAKQGMQTPTAFEIETVMAFLVMKQWQVDVAVIECGMGGRTDATNIIDVPRLCLFAHIGLDHTGFLGDTIDEIATEKYAILKPGTAVVSVKQDSSAAVLLQEKCEDLSLPLVIADPQEVTDIQYSMDVTSFRYHGSVFEMGQAGTFQIENAIAAIEAAGMMRTHGFGKIGDAAIRDALRLSRWKGRFECVSRKPYVIVDGAHNPQAATELRHSLETYFPGECFNLICGVFRDKDYMQIMEIMSPLAKRIYTVTPPGKRGLPARELAESVKIRIPRWIETPLDQPYDGFRDAAEGLAEQNEMLWACNSVAEALERATREQERTIVFGSLSFLYQVYEYFAL